MVSNKQAENLNLLRAALCLHLKKTLNKKLDRSFLKVVLCDDIQ